VKTVHIKGFNAAAIVPARLTFAVYSAEFRKPAPWLDIDGNRIINPLVKTFSNFQAVACPALSPAPFPSCDVCLDATHTPLEMFASEPLTNPKSGDDLGHHLTDYEAACATPSR